MLRPSDIPNVIYRPVHPNGNSIGRVTGLYSHVCQLAVELQLMYYRWEHLDPRIITMMESANAYELKDLGAMIARAVEPPVITSESLREAVESLGAAIAVLAAAIGDARVAFQHQDPLVEPAVQIRENIRVTLGRLDDLMLELDKTIVSGEVFAGAYQWHQS